MTETQEMSDNQCSSVAVSASSFIFSSFSLSLSFYFVSLCEHNSFSFDFIDHLIQTSMSVSTPLAVCVTMSVWTLWAAFCAAVTPATSSPRTSAPASPCTTVSVCDLWCLLRSVSLGYESVSGHKVVVCSGKVFVQQKICPPEVSVCSWC